MFYTILRALPGGENFKVIVGVVAICGVGTAGPVSYTHLTLPTIYSV